jgi:hypothetical protein
VIEVQHGREQRNTVSERWLKPMAAGLCMIDKLSKNSAEASRSSNVRAKGNNHLRCKFVARLVQLAAASARIRTRLKAESKDCIQVCHFLNNVIVNQIASPCKVFACSRAMIVVAVIMGTTCASTAPST